MPSTAIALLGTLDSKGQEIACVRDVIVRQGIQPLIMDVGVRGMPTVTPGLCDQAGTRRLRKDHIAAISLLSWALVRRCLTLGRPAAMAHCQAGLHVSLSCS